MPKRNSRRVLDDRSRKAPDGSLTLIGIDDWGEAFARQVRDALAHLYDPIYLQTHPLTRLVPPDPGPRSPGIGRALRQVLVDAIEALHPLTGAGGNAASGAGYQILQLRYVEGLDVPAVQARLALGRSEYYREQQRGLEAVVSLVWDRWKAERGDAAKLPSAVSSLGPATLDAAPPAHPRYDLPIPTTSFIARAGELARVSQRLRESRLLTLTGSGGCGKTRLALEVAREIMAEYSDGVWLVELAPLVDPTLVPDAVAAALGVREAPGRPLLASLIDHLRHRQALLVLDNCEHLIDACAQVVDALLPACAQLRILVTSRELLGIAGEATWRVPSLSVVDPRSLPRAGANPVSTALKAEAVQLLVDRARLVAPSFSVTSANALALAQVCQRLDGIPLAIELAAARLAVLTVDDVATRLDQRFRLLTGGHRTALRRQQTLWATIDWSYQLLSEAERTLLRRLAVFAGGWSMEAAEVVAANTDLVAGDVLDVLSRLVAKSLVQIEEPGANGRGDQRYRLEGNLERARTLQEESVAQARVAGDRILLAQSLRQLSYPVTSLGDWAGARRLLDEAVAVSRDAGYKREIAFTLHSLARVLTHEEATEVIEPLLVESLAIARESGDPLTVCEALFGLSWVYHRRGEVARARHALDECLALARRADVRFMILLALLSLGDLATTEVDRERAIDWYRQALRVVIDTQRGMAAYALDRYAAVRAASGDYYRAVRLLGVTSTAPRSEDPFLLVARSAPSEEDLAAARQALGESAFAAAWAEGQAMTLEEAVAFALDPGQLPPMPDYFKSVNSVPTISTSSPASFPPRLTYATAGGAVRWIIVAGPFWHIPAVAAVAHLDHCCWLDENSQGIAVRVPW